jgi:NAD(P)-dependent dehydrogenase (short-subunit alcohol dehydrogenase family)
MPSALITGTSSGLGHGLAELLLDAGWDVFGCSRRGCDLPGIRDRSLDLTAYEQLPGALHSLLEDVKNLDLVVLNAGVLGEIRDLNNTPLSDVKKVMEINLWANKAVMDWLHAWHGTVAQVVMISSGASILGNRGWGGYALSKAALNMLAKLYAHEFAATHISALAPGIIDTAMMDYLCEQADPHSFPALQRLRAARGTATMPGPRDAAAKVLSVVPQLRERPSGSFVDIREILEPELFARLYTAD